MHPSIRVSVESARGCGYRKPGGTYLVCDGPGIYCGRLPIPLDVCPCCSQGIKPARGWTWVDGGKLAEVANPCCATPCDPRCPLVTFAGRVGLVWVGELFYPTPQDFAREVRRLGISRKLKSVPRGFQLGETWVWLAHRKTIPQLCGCGGATDCERCYGTDTTWTPGVFHAFKPSRLEVVVTGEEPDEEIEALVRRGLSPVQVIRDVDHVPLFGDPN